MKNKFNFVDFGGGQIRFAALLITFILVMAYSSGIGQTTTPVSFVGDDRDRDNAYGVQDHTFEVCMAYIINGNPTSYTCDDYTTYNCATSFAGTYLGSIDVAEDYDNILKIYPYSVNNYADYLNGVTTADIVRIQQHILNTVPITDPFRKVSADAEGDKDIDTDDVDEIRDLILGRISNLTRTSWEWWNSEEIIYYGTTWTNNPWNYTINQNWPGGIIFGGLDHSELEDSDNHHLWFDFQTTKIGNIQDGNDWVCGTDDLKNEQLMTRSSWSFNKSAIPVMHLDAGTYFDLIIRNDIDSKLLGFQLPILLTSGYFDVISVVSNKAFNAYWNFNKNNGDFTSLWYSLNLEGIDLPEMSEVIRIRVLLKKDIENLNTLINVNGIKPIEFVNDDLGTRINGISLEIENIIPSTFKIQVSNIQNLDIEILSPASGESLLNLYEISGKMILSNKMNLVNGINDISLPESLSPGVYFINCITNDQYYSLKFNIN